MQQENKLEPLYMKFVKTRHRKLRTGVLTNVKIRRILKINKLTNKRISSQARVLVNNEHRILYVELGAKCARWSPNRQNGE